MNRLLVVAVLFSAVACEPQTPQGPTELETVARSALSCPTGSLTWSVDGGATIDQAGNFAAPPCTAPYADATYNVTVSGCSRSTTIPITVSDSLKTLTIYCGVVAPETCCRIPPLTVSPGGTIQFYASLQYSCAGHVVYSQIPPALCP